MNRTVAVTILAVASFVALSIGFVLGTTFKHARTEWMWNHCASRERDAWAQGVRDGAEIVGRRCTEALAACLAESEKAEGCPSWCGPELPGR